MYYGNERLYEMLNLICVLAGFCYEDGKGNSMFEGGAGATHPWISGRSVSTLEGRRASSFLGGGLVFFLASRTLRHSFYLFTRSNMAIAITEYSLT